MANFSGTLDGNGYTICNLHIDIFDDSGEIIYVGLFGYTDEALIKNIKFSGVNINVNAYGASVGSIIGCTSSTSTNYTLENCVISDGVLKIDVENYGFIGGLSGAGSDAKSCYNYANINITRGRDVLIGGILGNSASVDDSINFGNIVVDSNNSTGGEHKVFVGGIAGQGDTITKCSNEGTIDVTLSNIYEVTTSNENSHVEILIGGIASSYAQIENCYNCGNLSADAYAENTASFGHAMAEVAIGGVIGDPTGRSITSCYNKGEMKSFAKAVSRSGSKETEEYIGGIIGRCYRGEVSGYCYYINTQERGVGKVEDENIDSNKCIALSSSEMQNHESFKGFDFNTIWAMGSGDYPYPVFQWQEGGTSPDKPELPDENLVLGWTNLENGNVVYYKYENNQCVLLKDGIYRLHYLDDNGILYEGNWKFDSNGYVVTGEQEEHYYYEYKDGIYPYGMEIEEDVRNILKTNPSAYLILGGYDFFYTFKNDLSLWDVFLLAAHPSEGVKELVDLGIGWIKWGIDKMVNPFEKLMKDELPPSVMENHKKDVSLNKKILEKILEEKFAQTTSSQGALYKVTKKGVDKITGELADEFEDVLEEKRKQFESNPNGSWSDSYKEFMDSMDDSNKKSHFSFVSNQVADSVFTLVETNEEWQELFMDYSEKIDFLELIKNASNNEALYDAANELQFNYQNKFMNTLAHTLYTVFEQGNDWREVITGQKKIPIPSVDFNENMETNIRNNISAILISKVHGLKEGIAIVEFFQNLTGAALAIDTIVETQAMYDASLDLLRDTSNALLKDEAGSKELIEYQNAFELVKYMTIMRYEAMKKFYEVDENNDSDKKVKEEFLEKEIEKLKSMNSYNYFAKKSSVFLGKWNDLQKRYEFYRDVKLPAYAEEQKVIYYADCWKWINGEKYYFDKDGHPYEGKQAVWDKKENKNYTYYFSTGTGDCDANKDHYGAMQTGEVKLEDKEYYFYPKTGRGVSDAVVQVSPNEMKYYDKDGVYDPHKQYKGVITQEPGTKKYLINCPVDIYVYDTSNNLVASIINNEIQNASNSKISVEIDKNEQKVVCVPFDEDYVSEI